MKMIKLLKKELNNTKEEFSDGPWCFYAIVLAIAICVTLIICYAFYQSPERECHERTHERTMEEYCDSGKLFATDKVTVTDRYLAKSSSGKGVQKCLTVKFNGESYYISDSKLYDKAKKGDKLKGYYVYDYIWDSYCKVLYLAEGKHVRMQEEH